MIQVTHYDLKIVKELMKGDGGLPVAVLFGTERTSASQCRDTLLPSV